LQRVGGRREERRNSRRERRGLKMGRWGRVFFFLGMSSLNPPNYYLKKAIDKIYIIYCILIIISNN
jgi:hypothetical protein